MEGLMGSCYKAMHSYEEMKTYLELLPHSLDQGISQKAHTTPIG